MVTCPKPALIENVPELQKFLSTLSKSSALYLDIEGLNLSRHGTISIITILAHPSNQVHLIDVSALGDLVFSTASEDGKTLKAILEDGTIYKYIWDVRNDANALWFLYGVSLGGVTDIQLLENASRPSDKTYVHGLEKSILNDLKLKFVESNRWLRTKRDIQQLMRADVFSRRPMDNKTVEYCLNDVNSLSALREIYLARIKPEWLTEAKEESEHRTNLTRSMGYDPHCQGKKLRPWDSGGEKPMLTIEDICDMMEEEREEALAREMFGYDDEDYGYDDMGSGNYEDFGAMDSEWDTNS